VIVHRWSIYNIKPIGEILISSMYFVVFCNVVMLVVSVFHYLYLLYLKRKHDIKPSILYSYMYLSIFILLLNVSSIIYHFIQSSSQDSIMFGAFSLGVIFVFASEILATYLKKNQSYLAGYFIMFAIVTFGPDCCSYHDIFSIKHIIPTQNETPQNPAKPESVCQIYS